MPHAVCRSFSLRIQILEPLDKACAKSASIQFNPCNRLLLTVVHKFRSNTVSVGGMHEILFGRTTSTRVPSLKTLLLDYVYRFTNVMLRIVE